MIKEFLSLESKDWKEMGREMIKPVVLILGLTFAAYQGINYMIPKVVPKLIPAYAEKNLESIMHEQESKLGIKYPGKPEIKYQTKEKTNKQIRRRIANASPLTEVLGYYNPYNDTITIVLDKIEPFEYKRETKRVLAHELGHFYADKLSEKTSEENWPTLNSAGTRLVSEGIAKYFERAITGRTDDFNDNEYPQGENVQNGGFSDQRVIYEGGGHLVKPIIDKYGKKGINFLIHQSPDSNAALEDVPAYQKRVLYCLSNPDISKHFEVREEK
jgi:hypothetical protein